MLERDIFIEAMQKETAAERAEYLHSACGADSELRLRVERLLVDHDRQNTCFVDSASPGLFASAVQAASAFAEPGSTIGRYKLLEPIGEGGYGVVFMAEQKTPVQRRVALKIIKPGMDTKQVIARFEAERQALALMEHPNIAKVFDAGVTETGRPYFVMELVKGVPITTYCDEQRLTPRQRVELFVHVCHAVQHAHQKGIIHRDIKPTNVLIALYDGNPVPKVIDFGVAKATGQQLTDRTMFTGFGDVIGTPQYMSPEQAELNQLDIDTRSDIYSLGVLLYELLTGTTPLESKRVREVALLEVLRAVREEEPPRPSTRLTTSAELPAIAAQRGLEPTSLSAAVKGELDWIIMKALEKDRSRRYETANGLAMDIERYLSDEPVLACPPSAMYRFRKFGRRHRGPLLGGAVTLAALLALVVGLAISNRIIAGERNEKARALHEKERALAEARDSAARAEMQRQRADLDFRQARIAVGWAVSNPGLGLNEWSQIPPPVQKRLLDEATKYYQSLVHEDTSDPSLLYETAIGYRSLAIVQNRSDDQGQAESFLRKAMSIFQKLSDEYPREQTYRHELARSYAAMGENLAVAKRWAEVQSSYDKSLDIYHHLLQEQPGQADYVAGSANASYWLGQAHRRQKQFDDAEADYRRAIDAHARLLALPTPPTQLSSQLDLYAANYRELITMLAMRGHARDALELCARWTALNSDDHEVWREVVAVEAWEGDTEGYRRSCQAMLKHFENSEVPEIAERTAKSRSLMPISAGDTGRAMALADRALTAEKHPYYRYFLGAKAMVEYRAGHDAAALQWIDRVGPDASSHNELDAMLFSFRAMALHQLGRRDEARAALKSGESILPKPPEGADGIADDDGQWLWWLAARIVDREAASLIGS